MRNHLLILSLLLFIGASCDRDHNNISYLKTFAKAFGYVKYFHPSNEAENMDWNRFSAHGADEISKCKNNTEVIHTLNRLFKPIGPSIIFSDTKQKYNFKSITPYNFEDYHETYWQHIGVSTGMNHQNGIYSSVRVYPFSEMLNDSTVGKFTIKNEPEKDTSLGESLFKSFPKFGELIEKEIGPGIYCQIPLNLYRNEEGTYPKSNTINNLLDRLDTIYGNPNLLSVRLGNVISMYNVFQHFYPYFDEVDVNWDKELETALKRSYIDQTDNDHLITLQKFTAPLKDGHIWVSGGSNGWHLPSLTWEWIEEKLVITEVFNDSLNVNIGDVVTKVNDLPSEKYFEEVNSRISAGTEGYLKYRAKTSSLLGNKDSELTIEINHNTIILKRDQVYKYGATEIEIQKNDYIRLDENIIYLNLGTIEMDTITKLLPELTEANGIICDLRGYPNGNHYFISHLLSEKDTSKAWMRVPKIIYPDQENIIGYEDYGWEMEPKEPYLGDKKVVFIIDGRAISYAESFMSFVEAYNLAIIVGQPTAGTNGNVNPFNLLGNYGLSWTGMKVVKHNGSQHHAIGILPNIYVTKTIAGIKSGRDEFLEKAIEVINN